MTIFQSFSRMILFVFFIVPLFLFPPALQAKEADSANCKDHPLFTRMQNMHIVMCKTSEFDRVVYKTGKGTDTAVEGKRFDIKYTTDSGNSAPTPIAIIRNHQQAITKIGGVVLYEDQRYTVLKLSNEGKEIWAQVDTAWGKGYLLTIIEKQEMAQEVVATAELFKSGLRESGHVEISGIYFDTGKSVLKPESNASVAEISKLLKADPTLKVFVVGHTDNVATLDLNMNLSLARADAVVHALVAEHGIAADRLIGRGVGPLSPVVSNDSEEGRAKNRRVELVKR